MYENSLVSYGKIYYYFIKLKKKIEKLNKVKKQEDDTYHDTVVLYRYITIQIFIGDTHPSFAVYLAPPACVHE